MISSQPVVVLSPADTGYHTVRIPAVVRVGDHLLAFAEGRRHSADDAGEIDLVLRRSADDGATWGPLTVVASAAGQTCGNPAPVVDPASGDVVLLSVRNPADATERSVVTGTDPDRGRRVWLQRSPDAGVTWTDPAEITDQVRPPGWGWYATGPGHGIALTHPPHRGRLVVPANHSARSVATEADPDAEALGPPLYGGHVLLSDDGGRTWRVGFVDRDDDPVAYANESTVAELPDGRLHLDARNHRGTGAPRLAAWSCDGGETLTASYAGLSDVTAPGVQGSVLALPDGRLLLTTPADPTERRRLTVHVSVDGGRRWVAAHELPDDRAGYSDLVQLDRARVGLLYEGGTDTAHDELRFVVLDLS